MLLSELNPSLQMNPKPVESACVVMLSSGKRPFRHQREKTICPVNGSIMARSAPLRSLVMRCMEVPLLFITNKFVVREPPYSAVDGARDDVKQIRPSGIHTG